MHVNSSHLTFYLTGLWQDNFDSQTGSVLEMWTGQWLVCACCYLRVLQSALAFFRWSASLLCVVDAGTDTIQKEIELGTEVGNKMQEVLQKGEALSTDFVMQLIRCVFSYNCFNSSYYFISCLTNLFYGVYVVW